MIYYCLAYNIVHENSYDTVIDDALYNVATTFFPLIRIEMRLLRYDPVLRRIAATAAYPDTAGIGMVISTCAFAPAEYALLTFLVVTAFFIFPFSGHIYLKMV